jgi:trehalose 6-phosphate phosphatase
LNIQGAFGLSVAMDDRISAPQRHGLPEIQPDWALFLDIDGTLLELAPTPGAVIVPDGLIELLRAVSGALDGAVALVSGRAIGAIDALLKPLTLPAAGQHGAEMRMGGGGVETIGAADAGLGELLRLIRQFAESRPGLLIEPKGMTIAVHCRAAPECQAELGAFLDDCIGDGRAGLEVMRGNLVFEIKHRDIDKGTAVERFMRTPPFAGRMPVFVGDDRTDEDGFAAARMLGGHGVKVGPAGQSVADWSLAAPGDVHAWLAAIAAAPHPASL